MGDPSVAIVADMSFPSYQRRRRALLRDDTSYSNRSVRKAPIALSACRAASNSRIPVTNPCGIPIHTSNSASTPAATARST